VRRGVDARAVRVSLSQITTLDWPFERDVAFYRAAGVRAVGVSVRKLDACGLAHAKALLDDAGLAVSCLTSSGRFPLDDPAGTDAAIARTRGHVAAAAALGAGCLMVLPGHAPALRWDEQAARARPILETLAADAARHGVRLALEPVSQQRADLGFLHTFHDALDYAEGLAAPTVGVVLELANAWVERHLHHDIATRTARIALVQVSDFELGTLATNDRVVPGDGHIPLRDILASLHDAGYAGWYDLELLGPKVEAEGYEKVVPRALTAFDALWR
jgi:sugar phosphate isomerase/epimerase